MEIFEAYPSSKVKSRDVMKPSICKEFLEVALQSDFPGPAVGINLNASSSRNELSKSESVFSRRRASDPARRANDISLCGKRILQSPPRLSASLGRAVLMHPTAGVGRF